MKPDEMAKCCAKLMAEMMEEFETITLFRCPECDSLWERTVGEFVKQ